MPTGRSTILTWRPVLAACGAIGIALGLAACGSVSTSISPRSGPTGTTVPRAAPGSSTTVPPAIDSQLRPPAVPAVGAYLGAWLHPASRGSGSSAFAVEQQNVAPVRAALGRSLAILHLYVPWGRAASTATLDAVAADGAMPMVDWGCGPGSTSISSGADDARITNFARTLEQFGKPVFLRWCWEMNLVKAHPAVGGPAAFTAAWVHLRTLFRQAGATNVSFVWCPAVTGADPVSYFPGDASVDWIGVDGYDRTGSSTFSDLFAAFYATWATEGRPMMVAETGAAGPAQPAYLGSIATDLPTLPQFKAVLYFDAPGPAGAWQLTPAGLAAFGALARNPYFQPA